MSAAPSEAAPGENKARRPGLRGHHKLYLAAVALVAVCVWLIVWLVVFGKVLPDDIVGFAAVVFQVTVKTGIMALLFARYVAGAGTVVAPADPEGKVGAAPGLRAWAHEAFELDAASARARGGVDAELHVRRIRMRLACLQVWALLAAPLACVYALDPKKCGWFPERKIVEQEPCTGVNPCCVYRDALPGPPITSSTDVEARLEAVNAWLERHDDAAAAFLERVNGTATVISKDAILVEDDVACGTMGCGGL